MRHILITLMLCCISCTGDLDDFDHEEKAFDKNLVGVWLLDGKIRKTEFSNQSHLVIKTLSIDSSGVFLLEQMQLPESTLKPSYLSKFAGSTSTENGEITLIAKRKFQFNEGFESEYSEWKKVDDTLFDRHSFHIRGDSLVIEDLRDDIVDYREIFLKMN